MNMCCVFSKETKGFTERQPHVTGDLFQKTKKLQGGIKNKNTKTQKRKNKNQTHNTIKKGEAMLICHSPNANRHTLKLHVITTELKMHYL